MNTPTIEELARIGCDAQCKHDPAHWSWMVWDELSERTKEGAVVGMQAAIDHFLAKAGDGMPTFEATRIAFDDAAIGGKRLEGIEAVRKLMLTAHANVVAELQAKLAAVEKLPEQWKPRASGVGIDFINELAAALSAPVAVVDEAKVLRNWRAAMEGDSEKPATITHNGVEYIKHTPGDPCPVDGETEVWCAYRSGRDSGNFIPASNYDWGVSPCGHPEAEIIGYRVIQPTRQIKTEPLDGGMENFHCEPSKPITAEPQSDRWAKEKAAHAKGLKIEYRCYEGDGWDEWEETTNPIWGEGENIEYRIAPGQEPRDHHQPPAGLVLHNQPPAASITLCPRCKAFHAKEGFCRDFVEVLEGSQQLAAAWRSAAEAEQQQVKKSEAQAADLFKALGDKAREINSLVEELASTKAQLKLTEDGAKKLDNRLRDLEGLLAASKTDASEWKKLAAKNGEEADNLRRAAGVDPDMTIGEGVEHIKGMRQKITTLESRLKLLEPRPVSQKPTREDASNGDVLLLISNGSLLSVGWEASLWTNPPKHWVCWLSSANLAKLLEAVETAEDRGPVEEWVPLGPEDFGTHIWWVRSSMHGQHLVIRVHHCGVLIHTDGCQPSAWENTFDELLKHGWERCIAGSTEWHPCRKPARAGKEGS
jgi:hypothetical protein